MRSPDDDDEDEGLLYHTNQLVSAYHKRNQIILLKDSIYNLKKKFNKEFDEVCRSKNDEKQKIKERNERIQKIANELKLKEELFSIASRELETPEKLLEVCLLVF